MERTASCPSCRRGVYPEDAFCSWCGSSIQARDARTGESRRNVAHDTIATADRLNCGSCNSPVLPGDLFCSTCGARHAGDDEASAFDGAWSQIPQRVTEASGGKFSFIRELGRGGMGLVFLARDEELERLVAIKVLSPTWLTDETMVRRFQREARTIARLRHESIITVYDEGRAGNLSYFVMDYIEGVSLSHVLRAHGPLPIPIVEAILYRVGSALDYAHRPGRAIVHRDVKPSNIMIDSEGLVVVMDFGISKASERPSGLTSTGLVMGTPEYMSPEQCRGNTVTHESDQYSLGAVTYAMLTGAPPFTGPFYQVLMAHQTEPVPPIAGARPDCPAELAAVVERMLAKAPGDRWPTVGDALRSLGLRPLPHDDPALVELGRLVHTTAARSASSPAERPSGSDTRRTPTSLRIVPHPEDLEVGDEIDLVATVLFPDGVEEPGREMTWESTDPAIARVDPTTGQLVAVGPGSAYITASGRGLEESVAVEVRPPQVVRVAIDPSDTEVRVGETLQLQASPRDKRGSPVAGAVAWSSSDPRTVGVSDDGLVTARRPGSASVLAHCGGVGAATAIRVVADDTVPPHRPVALVRISTPPEGLRATETFRLVATPLDVAGQALGDAVSWTVEDPDLIEGLGGGRFRALRPGEAAVVAEAGGVRMRVHVPIAEKAPPARDFGRPAGRPESRSDRPGTGSGSAGVAAAPVPVGSEPGPEGAETRAGSTPGGAFLRSRTVLVGAPLALLLVVAALVFRPGAGGTAAPPPVADLTVLAEGAEPGPDGISARVGERLTLSATVLDAGGAPLDRPVAWSSSDPAVASIDPSGLLAALAPGNVRLSARADEVERSVTLIVVAPATGIAVVDAEGEAVDELDLEVGQTAVLTAEVIDPDGRPLAGERVGWRSSSDAVVRVDDAGRLSARSAGEAVLTASAGDLQTSVAVSVSRPVVEDTPPPPPPPANGTLRLVVRPWANVFVDGARRGGEGERNLDVPLAPGRHQLRLEGPGEVRFDTTIVIESGRVTTVAKQLVGGQER